MWSIPRQNEIIQTFSMHALLTDRARRFVIQGGINYHCPRLKVKHFNLYFFKQAQSPSELAVKWLKLSSKKRANSGVANSEKSSAPKFWAVKFEWKNLSRIKNIEWQSKFLQKTFSGWGWGGGGGSNSLAAPHVRQKKVRL